MGLQPVGSVAWAVSLLMVLTSCGGSSPPDRPSSDTPSAAGAVTVYGTERLDWLQPGDMPYLGFIAYVDGQPVALDAATCNWATPEAQCASPLPSMTDGVHTIALAAVNPFSGLEGPQSASITVQKVSARSVVSAASFPDTRVASGEPAFSVDVIARGLQGPIQLAATPDGRLLIAEGNARVRVVRPGEIESLDRALDAGLLQPPPASGLGLAVHPDFARNHFVYVAFLFRDRTDETRLRIVRLREVGDTLGEPLPLFEAPVVVARQAAPVLGDGSDAGAAGVRFGDSPRLAFGPDGLLYTLLPLGLEFDNEPAASRPHASMLRIADDGRAPGIGPLTGIIAHPLGLSWHPSTAALWLIFPGVDGETVVRPSGLSPIVGNEGVAGGVWRVAAGPTPASEVLVLQPAGALDLAHTSLQGIDLQSLGVLRLVMPILAESVLAGWSGQITDIVPAGAGTLYVSTNDTREPTGGGVTVLRLGPRAR